MDSQAAGLTALPEARVCAQFVNLLDFQRFEIWSVEDATLGYIGSLTTSETLSNSFA